jgi:CHAT domain-containing protein
MLIPALLSLLASAGVEPAAPPLSPCEDGPAPRLLVEKLEIIGQGEQRVDIAASAGEPLLVIVAEQGVDVRFQVLGPGGKSIANADNPIARTGVQSALFASAVPVTLLVQGKEHETHRGAVSVHVLAASAMSEPCRALQRRLTAADADYFAAHVFRTTEQGTGARTAEPAFEAAAQSYREALELRTTLTAGAAATIEHALASTYYYDLRAWSRSSEWAERAASSYERAHDQYGRARARAVYLAAQLEVATRARGANQGAGIPGQSQAWFARLRRELGELEAFHRSRGERHDAALQTNNIGLGWYYEARFNEAIVAFTAAMQEFGALKETPREALALQNIATCHWGQGRLAEASGEFEAALKRMKRWPHPDLYLITLNNSALLHYAAGKFDESIRMHTDAVRLAREAKDTYHLAHSYYGLGVTYYAIGDTTLAAQFLGLALEQHLTPDRDPRIRISSNRALAVIRHEEGNYRESVRLNREAWEQSVAPATRSRIKVALARDYAALGDLKSARAEVEPVIAESGDFDPLVAAQALLERGRLLMTSTPDFVAARRDFETALRTFQATQFLSGEFEAHLELARLGKRQGNDTAAKASIAAALGLSDEIASQTANPEYRSSLAESLRPAHDLMIEILFAEHAKAIADHDANRAADIAKTALDFADATRARTFDDVLARRQDSGNDARVARMLDQREQILRTLADRRYYLSTREDRVGSSDTRAGLLREEIANLRKDLAAVSNQISQHLHTAGIRTRTTNQPLAFTALPANRALIQYWLGKSRALAWTVTRGGVRWQELGRSEDIERGARALHAAMSNYSGGAAARQAASARVHEQVLAPLMPALASVDELVIVPDGLLHIVPFAALRDARPSARYLVQDFDIAFVPALRHLETRTSPAPTTATATAARALIVADPIYQDDDDRIAMQRIASTPKPAQFDDLIRRNGNDPRTLRRLTASAREANAIQRILVGARVDLLAGTQATREELLARNLAAYRYIHIAAHGAIDTEIPQLSSLVLGAHGVNGRVANQRVWIDDLLHQTFTADVVVLSACETSLGPVFSGEGPLSLRYAVLARGARSVVSTLWPVADVITADLMTEMYGELRNRVQTDKALAVAMRRLLERRPSLDPALWAPYTTYVALQHNK